MALINVWTVPQHKERSDINTFFFKKVSIKLKISALLNNIRKQTRIIICHGSTDESKNHSFRTISLNWKGRAMN